MPAWVLQRTSGSAAFARPRANDAAIPLHVFPFAHPLRHDPLLAAYDGRAAVKREGIELPAPIHVAEVDRTASARRDREPCVGKHGFAAFLEHFSDCVPYEP